MINLIKKDLVLSRMYVVLGIIFSIFFGFTIILSNSITSMYIIFAAYVLLFSSVIFFGMMENEIKNKANLLVLSLPIDRGSIVISKYITYILILLTFNVFYLFQVLYFICSRNWNTPYIPFGYVNLNLILTSLGLGILIASIMLFIYYLIIYKRKEISSFATIIAYLIGTIGISITTRIDFEGSALENILLNEHINLISLGFLLISLIIYILSMKVSIYLYKKTEI